jgi:tetratricopeptide (TPR) repeat protein
MRRISIALLALGISVLAAPAARAEEDSACFAGDYSDRRIAACSELLARPGVDAWTRADAFAARALSFSLKGQYEAAIRDYDQAIRIRPDYAIALNNRAWAYFKWGRGEHGLDDVEKSLRLDPSSHHAFDTRAHIRQWMGESAGALRDYELAMRLGGERFVKLYQCGLAQAKLYSGPAHGRYTAEMRQALLVCVQRRDCDPLPPDEDCQPTTS